MTKDEAIELLNCLLGMVDDNQGNDYDEAFHMAIDALRAEPHWIPCSERLPDKPIRVQAQLDNWWIVTAYYDNAWHTVPDIGQELKNDEVIAWMPLPEPWRGEEHG